MSNEYVHAESSVMQWGGRVEDYLPIHKWLDQTKSHVGDNRHRVILHNAWGIGLAQTVFGPFITNSAGERVFVKDICESHVLEDLGMIPSLSDCLASLKTEPWMSGALTDKKLIAAMQQLAEPEVTPPAQKRLPTRAREQADRNVVFDVSRR